MSAGSSRPLSRRPCVAVAFPPQVARRWTAKSAWVAAPGLVASADRANQEVVSTGDHDQHALNGRIIGVDVSDTPKARFSRGDVIGSRYEVEQELGSGMLGASYLVRNIESGKHLALKVLHPKMLANPRDRARFEEIFLLVKEVRHEALVRLGEVGEHNDLVWFTQQYFQSQSLRELIDEYQAAQRSFTLQKPARSSTRSWKPWMCCTARTSSTAT